VRLAGAHLGAPISTADDDPVAENPQEATE
jgi:hypothetical protein